MDRLALVVPVFNERAEIDALLARLQAMAGIDEILFVDGGSSDATADIIAAAGFAVAVSPQKGRAMQMNRGAAHTGGDILWFLHADSLPPIDAPAHIRAVIAGGHRAGCFPIRFDSRHPLMTICAALSNLRVRLRGIAFGDQGIFIERALFEDLGGFAAIPLMEDYRLAMDLKKRGIGFALAKGKIVTSDRRFVAGGRLRTMIRMQKLQHRYRRGVTPADLAKAYDP